MLSLQLDILKPNFEEVDMKKNGNKYIFLDDIHVKFPEICETEILPQDEF